MLMFKIVDSDQRVDPEDHQQPLAALFFHLILRGFNDPPV